MLVVASSICTIALATGSDREAAEKQYAQAADTYDRALALAPDYIFALNNKGNALQSWADLRLSIGDEVGAAELRNQAEEARKHIDSILGE